ncbi:MAG: undecaprenyldiphospho-muramoylpentapeptide beta-N-acetylglucosaminyltransferase [Armatimonadetes bacterium]|nr:undecaprenyldiphospho-muramoylpentapeptide beta-N-acetylglucosaminyltransferase [Armatimonadota bacterium]
MRLAITGGGTGGHVYPALEVARQAREDGAEIVYLGSLRGQESAACQKLEIVFRGFPSAPLYSLKTPRGWKSLGGLIRARIAVKPVLRKLRPDAVFSTGGYSAGPVVSAAQALGIPVVIHEGDSVPGRTNRMFAPKAYAVATTFESAAAQFPGCKVVRTGQPIRKELRDAARNPQPRDLLPLILVSGGSQGAQALNEASLGAAQRMVGRAMHWLHSTGRNHFEAVFHSYERLGLKDDYEVRSFLDVDAMAEAYCRSTLLVARSGVGTLSEAAAFRLPGIFVPLPHAHANHQYHNAKELEAMGACSVLEQSEVTPARLEAEILGWLDDQSRRERASEALAKWDVPDATERVVALVNEAALMGRKR